MTAILTTTALDIVTAALRLLGEVDANQTPDASETQDGIEALNFLIKDWQNQGLHLWTKTEGVLFLDVGKTDYLLGPSGDEATLDDDFVNTTLTVAGIATDTTLNIVSSAGMTIGDKIGVKLDDGTRQWTTISTIPNSTSVTIPVTGLTSGAAIGNTVFAFTTLLDRPVRILQLRRDLIGGTDEIEANQWSRAEYFAQPNKASQGTINNWYYSPQLTNGRMYLWQTANNADQLARFTFERPIDIFDSGNDSPDFPAEWFRVLKYNLAADIAPEFTISQDRLDRIEAKASILLENALGFDSEADSISIQPNFGG